MHDVASNEAIVNGIELLSQMCMKVTVVLKLNFFLTEKKRNEWSEHRVKWRTGQTLHLFSSQRGAWLSLSLLSSEVYAGLYWLPVWCEESSSSCEILYLIKQFNSVFYKSSVHLQKLCVDKTHNLSNTRCVASERQMKSRQPVTHTRTWSQIVCVRARACVCVCVWMNDSAFRGYTSVWEINGTWLVNDTMGNMIHYCLPLSHFPQHTHTQTHTDTRTQAHTNTHQLISSLTSPITTSFQDRSLLISQAIARE